MAFWVLPQWRRQAAILSLSCVSLYAGTDDVSNPISSALASMSRRRLPYRRSTRGITEFWAGRAGLGHAFVVGVSIIQFPDIHGIS